MGGQKSAVTAPEQPIPQETALMNKIHPPFTQLKDHGTFPPLNVTCLNIYHPKLVSLQYYIYRPFFNNNTFQDKTKTPSQARSKKTSGEQKFKPHCFCGLQGIEGKLPTLSIHFPLKSAYFENLYTPAIQVQTFPLEGPCGSLGNEISSKRFPPKNPMRNESRSFPLIYRCFDSWKGKVPDDGWRTTRVVVKECLFFQTKMVESEKTKLFL